MNQDVFLDANMKVIGENIRGLRKESRISQEKLGELVGVSESYIGNIERGEVRDPSFRVLCAIANAFHVSLDKLAYGAVADIRNFFVQELLKYSEGLDSKDKIMLLEMTRSLVEIVQRLKSE